MNWIRVLMWVLMMLALAEAVRTGPAWSSVRWCLAGLLCFALLRAGGEIGARFGGPRGVTYLLVVRPMPLLYIALGVLAGVLLGLGLSTHRPKPVKEAVA